MPDVTRERCFTDLYLKSLGLDAVVRCDNHQNDVRQAGGTVSHRFEGRVTRGVEESHRRVLHVHLQ